MYDYDLKRDYIPCENLGGYAFVGDIVLVKFENGDGRWGPIAWISQPEIHTFGMASEGDYSKTVVYDILTVESVRLLVRSPFTDLEGSAKTIPLVNFVERVLALDAEVEFYRSEVDRLRSTLVDFERRMEDVGNRLRRKDERIKELTMKRGADLLRQPMMILNDPYESIVKIENLKSKDIKKVTDALIGLGAAAKIANENLEKVKKYLK